MKALMAKLKVEKSKLLVYLIVYFCCGMIMQNIGIYFKIARFTYWWQVITCYLCYMVPVSLLIRECRWYEQYAYGVVAIGFLELIGYALGTSIAFDGNFIESWFNIRNFTLSMTLFFGLYFPLGNWAVSKVHKKFAHS